MITTRELAMTLLVLASTSAPAAVADLGMPPAFASYRSWRPLLAKPHPVSLQLWLRCMRPTPADWEAERRRVGPHAERYIMVYGSPPASKAASARQPFPPGAIIAKAKLRSPGEAPDGVAFMIKDPDGGFKDSGGWEFLYYPASGDRRATHDQCASCHRNAKRDYVFGAYPR